MLLFYRGDAVTRLKVWLFWLSIALNVFLIGAYLAGPVREVDSAQVVKNEKTAAAGEMKKEMQKK